jgi:YegS/Rv2252/BmrU family lipid kinase
VTRAFFVVNPAAGGGRGRRVWARLETRLTGLGIHFAFEETTGRGAATAIAQRAAHAGWPLVVALGGDGTVNEVVNGLVDASGRAHATLGVIAAGRGRDVCRNFDLASDVDRAAQRLVEGRDVAVDLGLASWGSGRRRYFLNSAGVGFDAAVAERVQASRGAGTIPYLLGIIATLRRYRPGAATIAVEDDRSAFDGPMMVAVVANGPYYGGGMKIVPAADPVDGWLDLVVVGDLGKLELLRWLPSVYRGTHLSHRKVTTRRGRTISIGGPGRLLVHVDGESVEASPVVMTVCQGALRIRR